MTTPTKEQIDELYAKLRKGLRFKWEWMVSETPGSESNRKELFSKVITEWEKIKGKIDEKEIYKVVQEFVKDDKIVKAISVSYSDFEKALQQFHLIEQSLEENGYDLDDDTSDYTIKEFHNGNFFNNATNDTTTIRIFLEESK